ncbi:ROK family protein [Dictyoglomus thermophilum]|uniref:Glucokinase n=1 Tax=Dictyoglomus thermophilum (strain ATCC 35947 / DSM 3960 / H-6-12) TaxID=309799 RepID=B5YDJ5_DICT6|nr:ROK family protein [Dictyoglomus thermophilum]ACI18929.1 glucokinase [Dictyoglomus thermophilum H-6-12]
MKRYLALDIGGTKIACGRFTEDGLLEEKILFPTRAERGYKEILKDIVSVLLRLKTEDTIALGVGTAGPLDRIKGEIYSPPNLPGWDGVPLKKDLYENLKIPIFIDNDANAACLGEYIFGAGKGVKNMVYVTVSTGIGGGIIINGSLVHGVRDSAGEVGHQTIVPDGPLCNCGNKGCLEALSSGTAIAKRAMEEINSGKDTILKQWAKNEKITAKHVREAMLMGDEVAREIWNNAMEYLGIGIGNIITIVSPERVVIGGSIGLSGKDVIEKIREVVKRRVFLVPVDMVDIVQAELGEDVGIYGAFAVALVEMRNRGGD